MDLKQLSSTIDAPSHSRLSKLHDCRRAYWYRYVQKLAAKGTATKPLAGKAGHAGLDILHRLGWGAIKLAQQAAELTYGEHVPPDAIKWLTAEHINGILHNYTEYWQEADADFQIYPLPADLIRKGNPYVKHI